MRDDYFKEALGIVNDPFVLVSMIARRAKMLRLGNRPLVKPIEKLSFEDVALREIIEGRITYVLGDVVVLEEIVGLDDIVTAKRAGNSWSDTSRSPFVDAHCDAEVSV
jgi:DNA-directed RNA polymerase subunit omega